MLDRKQIFHIFGTISGMIIPRTLRMSPGIFVQALNPMTGKMEWKNQPEDYDYQQELARAAFADMLHDTERVRTKN